MARDVPNSSGAHRASNATISAAFSTATASFSPNILSNTSNVSAHAANRVDLTNVIKCRRCKLIFKTLEDQRRHLMNSDDHMVCKQCFEEFTTVKGLEQHVRQTHPIDQNITCKCGQHFTRAAGLIAHLSERNCLGAPRDDYQITRIETALQNSTLEESINANENVGVAFKGQGIAPSVGGFGPVDPDDDLIFFDHPPKNGLSPDNAWSTEQNYPGPYLDLSELKSEGKGKETIKSTTETQAFVSAPSVLASKSNIEVAPAPVEEIDEWAPAKLPPPGEAVELSREQILEQIEVQRKLTEERNKKNPFHPACPNFNINKHWNPVLKFYKCPHKKCGKSKPNKDTFLAHLVSPAHQDDKITCVVCLRTYSSPTAYAQHFESQGKRCNARSLGNQIISPLTGGIIQVIGENPDSTPMYGAWVDEATGDLAAQVMMHNLKEQQKIAKAAAENARYHEEHPQW